MDFLLLVPEEHNCQPTATDIKYGLSRKRTISCCKQEGKVQMHLCPTAEQIQAACSCTNSSEIFTQFYLSSEHSSTLFTAPSSASGDCGGSGSSCFAEEGEPTWGQGEIWWNIVCCSAIVSPAKNYKHNTQIRCFPVAWRLSSQTQVTLLHGHTMANHDIPLNLCRRNHWIFVR